jgi:hypothetical protein
LTDIVGTFESISLFLSFSQGGKEHTGQDADNGDHYQQLDEGKALIDLFFHGIYLLVWVTRLRLAKARQNRHTTAPFKHCIASPVPTWFQPVFGTKVG